jgi:hypothetical protein
VRSVLASNSQKSKAKIDRFLTLMLINLLLKKPYRTYFFLPMKVSFKKLPYRPKKSIFGRSKNFESCLELLYNLLGQNIKKVNELSPDKILSNRIFVHCIKPSDLWLLYYVVECFCARNMISVQIMAH